MQKSSDLFKINIEIDEKDTNELVKLNQSILDENLSLSLYIKKLGLNDEELKDNSGVIHNFLNDRLLCEHCSKLSECQKKQYIGYQQNLSKNGKFLDTSLLFCSYRKEQDKILKNVYSETVDSIQYYLNASKLLSFLGTGNNSKTFKSLTLATTKINKRFPEKNKVVKGIAFRSLSTKKYENWLLSFACYVNAKKNHKVVILDSMTLFSDLNSYRSDEYEAGMLNLQKAYDAEVLILEDLTSDIFLSYKQASEQFYKLLTKRNNVNKLTYCYLDSTSDFNSFFRKAFYNLDSNRKKEAMNLVDYLFEDLLINELG